MRWKKALRVSLLALALIAVALSASVANLERITAEERSPIEIRVYPDADHGLRRGGRETQVSGRIPEPSQC